MAAVTAYTPTVLIHAGIVELRQRSNINADKLNKVAVSHSQLVYGRAMMARTKTYPE